MSERIVSLLRLAWLWLRIVGREWYGGRMGPVEAWRVVRCLRRVRT
jgi:hypothetical protein